MTKLGVILNFSLLLDITPTKKLSSPVSLLIKDHIFGKKVSLIAFRQILPKTLPVPCMFSYTIMTYLENLDGTKSLNTKKCSAGSSLKIILMYLHFYQNVPFFDVVLLHPSGVDFPLFPYTFRENLGDGIKSYATVKKFTHFPHQKNPP